MAAAGEQSTHRCMQAAKAEDRPISQIQAIRVRDRDCGLSADQTKRRIAYARMHGASSHTQYSTVLY
jgi:hypothetical protein